MTKQSVNISFLGIFLLTSLNGMGQESVVTAGDDFAFSSGSVSFTIGEPIIETFTSNSIQLTQGYQQGVIFTAAINEFNDDLIRGAFPNPTFSELNMELNNWANDCAYTLIDESGRIIFEGNLSPSSKNTLHLHELASGFYYLNIIDQLSTKKAVVTIQKIN
jgi:hypothetical protein